MKKLSLFLLALLFTMITVDTIKAIPSFTRRYGISCQGCHYRINRLNQDGLNLYRMGMRMAHTDNVTNNFGDYFNFMGQVDAKGKKGALDPVYTPVVRLYGAGALSKNFSFLAEATLAPTSEQELADIYAQYTSDDFGGNYFTVRFGQFLPLMLVDNPVEVAADRGGPFPRERRFGTEFGYSVNNKFWASAAVMQAADPNGIGKNSLYDVVLNTQYIIDNNGTSLGAYAWLGNYYKDNKDNTDSYTRIGFVGNYNFDKLLVTGGFSTGKGNSGSGGSATENGFFANLDYLLSEKLIPVVNFTWFDPNTDVDKNEQLVITASLFWWAAENVSIRPQIIYTQDKAKGDNYDTWRYAFRAQFIL